MEGTLLFCCVFCRMRCKCFVCENRQLFVFIKCNCGLRVSVIDSCFHRPTAFLPTSSSFWFFFSPLPPQPSHILLTISFLYSLGKGCLPISLYFSLIVPIFLYYILISRFSFAAYLKYPVSTAFISSIQKAPSSSVTSHCIRPYPLALCQITFKVLSFIHS